MSKLLAGYSFLFINDSQLEKKYKNVVYSYLNFPREIISIIYSYLITTCDVRAKKDRLYEDNKRESLSTCYFIKEFLNKFPSSDNNSIDFNLVISRGVALRIEIGFEVILKSVEDTFKNISKARDPKFIEQIKKEIFWEFCVNKHKQQIFGIDFYPDDY
jgi:hypothetical protein